VTNVAAKTWSLSPESDGRLYSYPAGHATPVGPEFYVSPTGNDTTGDGTIGNPWLTPVYAASQMTQEYTTLYFRAGTYDVPTYSDNNNTIPVIYPRAHNCTFTNYPGDPPRSAILRGGLNGANYGQSPTGCVIGPAGFRTDTFASKGCIIENLTIIGEVVFASSSVGYRRNTLRNCDVSIGGDGTPGLQQGTVVICNHNSDHVHIYNNKIHNAVKYDPINKGACGIMCYGVKDILIEQNSIYDNEELGIYFKDRTEICEVTRNYVKGNLQSGIVFGTNSHTLSDLSAGDIHQNVIQDNNRSGGTFDEWGGLTFIQHEKLFNIYNNTLYSNFRSGLMDRYAQIEYTCFNNIFSSSNQYNFVKYNYAQNTVGASYFDFNEYWPVGGAQWSLTSAAATLSAWRTQIQAATSMFGGNLTSAENSAFEANPNFLNASGTFSVASDFKRSAYPATGRGGSWPSVVGAYITGTEQIGANW
jgi:hypothetical protein